MAPHVLSRRAIVFLDRLQEVLELDAPPLWTRLLECYRRVGNIAAAVSLYTQKLQEIDEQDPG